MSTVPEITDALPNLSTKELQRVERALISIYPQRRSGIIYNDAYGVWTEEDQRAVQEQVLRLIDGGAEHPLKNPLVARRPQRGRRR